MSKHITCLFLLDVKNLASQSEAQIPKPYCRPYSMAIYHTFAKHSFLVAFIFDALTPIFSHFL